MPNFDYSETADGDLVMFYHSKRKLCYLSEGLILGAASHFDQKIIINHPECMHNGDDKCKLVISLRNKV